ncbi:hypothetical protein D8674_011866 [Pyrus ussuriensis x Pyrus communis]|uniref:Uncharacterized protein n=1 Tax=Pyrus ussuriensis x Pyrus communis TaxID=2448454 RepID=A0A5N5FZY5_9ROSA|nr:hypothetical protein D8674_011866 [Pyrus ussuriensis x Pyrus communis]
MIDAFTDLAQVTKSHIPTANVPAKMDVPNVRKTSFLEAWDAYLSDPHYISVLEETNPSLKTREISVYYASLDDVWRRNEIIVDDALAYAVAIEIMLSDDIKPCSFDECRLAVYVDDINLIEAREELTRTTAHLKLKFKMKDLDPFRPNEDDEEILEPKVLYLSAIGALLYLAQYTRPDIFFVVNLLARYSNAPTHRQYYGFGLVLSYRSSSDAATSTSRLDSPLVSYADVGYLSDLHKVRSQTGYKDYIKENNTKHIGSKFFFSHKKQEHQKIEVMQIRSQNNLVDLFTKSLSNVTFQNLFQGIDMRYGFYPYLGFWHSLRSIGDNVPDDDVAPSIDQEASHDYGGSDGAFQAIEDLAQLMEAHTHASLANGKSLYGEFGTHKPASFDYSTDPWEVTCFNRLYRLPQPLSVDKKTKKLIRGFKPSVRNLLSVQGLTSYAKAVGHFISEYPDVAIIDTSRVTANVGSLVAHSVQGKSLGAAQAQVSIDLFEKEVDSVNQQS